MPDFNDFMTVVGPLNNKPLTIASANVIAPVSFLTILTGNTVVKTITVPPILVGTCHVLAIQYAGVAGSDATGNISLLVTSIASQIVLYCFNPILNKYVPIQ